jgi:hypothetical protein
MLESSCFSGNCSQKEIPADFYFDIRKRIKYERMPLPDALNKSQKEKRSL